jgi:hypothetical protein
VHSECAGKIPEFFYSKMNQFNKQRQILAKITCYIKNIPCMKLAYIISKCEKLHSLGEILLLSAAIDIVEAMPKKKKFHLQATLCPTFQKMFVIICSINFKSHSLNLK